MRTITECGFRGIISVGSLGKGGSYVQVKNIHVNHVNFYHTTNGVRIKTWKGATGYARDITFEYLNFTNVKNPIIIDQYYCNQLYPEDCKAVENSDSGVQISDVTYKNAIGTSITEVAIRLDCSESVPCTGILLDSIQLKPTLHSHRNEDDEGFIMTIFMFLCLVPSGMSSSVLDFGAVGDGNTDDSQALLKAWQTICESGEENPTLIIPAGKTFFLNPVSFEGPCKQANIHVSLLGNLVAPDMLSWPKTANVNKWLKFAEVSGLIVDGSGQIDGRGETWWDCGGGGGQNSLDKLDGCQRPSALTFHGCTDLKLSDITSINSQSNHISIDECKGATVTNVHLTAPTDSKNTDGIDISKSTNIVIQDSFIATGDDCVAINGGSSFINITNIACGPGHGISVGSLGENGDNSIVEEIHVTKCNFTRTKNGVRIKTYPLGTGYAKKLTFEQIRFESVNNPIIIDQYYCPTGNCGSAGKNSAIQLSDVTYIGVHGSSVNQIAITLNCSATVPCKNIVMNDVNIKSTGGTPTTAVCNNAHGTESLTDPSVFIIISTIFLFLCLAPSGMSSSVLDFGAVGDGNTDDSQAFLKAWQTICESAEVRPTLIIPAGKTFFLNPVSFEGPCKPANIRVWILGNLVAPVMSSWPKTADVNEWLKFADVSGLIVAGRGQINGRGETWWDCGRKISLCKLDGCNRPTALKFNDCTDLKLSDITSINSQSNHISINECKGATITNVHLIAPEDSNNTDGIDISKSNNVVIQDSFIATGDDCVAINGGSSFINITNTACGPGHGISVGSLGENGDSSIVEGIHVKNCSFTGTTNGVRIKTWPFGTGYAKKLTFEQIRFENVKNPIIIDQYYCPDDNCGGKSSAIQVSDVTYIGVHGTSVMPTAITLNCSATVPCNNIVMNDVNIKSTEGIPTTAICNNAHGKESLTDPTEFWLIFMFLCLFPFSWSSDLDAMITNNFNVISYGAVGDGKTDDSQAFLNAWKAMCFAKFGIVFLTIPPSKTFLSRPLNFRGPCKSPIVKVSVEGNIIAPEMSKWNNGDKSRWLTFSDVNGLIVTGSGRIDGNGQSWWVCAGKSGSGCSRPAALTFHDCNNLDVSGLNIVNSPKNHITINDCKGAKISNIHIISPDSSPNTDGINLSNVMNVQIRDSIIKSGDDCIAINDGCSFVNITNVGCGPGHGISVGSLGANGDHCAVEEIHVRNCNFTRTQNGVRIKTWPGGSGYAKNVKFEQISFYYVNNPIIIDQYYCNGADNCKNHTANVHVSGITYNGLYGTSSTPAAINLSCSTSVPCTNIVMNGINLRMFNLMLNAKVVQFYILNQQNLINIFCNKNTFQAFAKAWAALKEAKMDTVELHIPADKTFLLGQVFFEGSCNSKSVHVSVHGNLLALEKQSWKQGNSCWLHFKDVDGLTVEGTGQINGRGPSWYKRGGSRPTTILFHNCNNLQLRGLTFIDSPKNHISINQVNRATVSNLHIIAPGDSDNTDGIDISESTHIEVRDVIIGTGDDCIAINGQSSFINITNVACGPGHGISVGSLGEHGAHETVEEVHVKNCNFTNTQNGVRIKTWPGGSGYARKISFEQITLISVKNPVIIDQYYCDPCDTRAENVKISEVTYRGVHGSSKKPVAISLNCSKTVACTEIVMNDVKIQSVDPGTKTYSVCINAHGTSDSTFPDVPCLS
ncbi:Polygalacturonase adpg1 [Thalictrum thalictroides]|uniref:Polygalacturonase adpg1 n=1 Tax=Thalictrum thalictroides TaxID=46969 RepID=A0A7J6WH92_THATH|nr:Polygalacturonase adpg1 [Thalictrum thalictroides]